MYGVMYTCRLQELSFCSSFCLQMTWMSCNWAIFVYCWLGLLTWKNSLSYNLYYVGWDVKDYSTQLCTVCRGNCFNRTNTSVYIIKNNYYDSNNYGNNNCCSWLICHLAKSVGCQITWAMTCRHTRTIIACMLRRSRLRKLVNSWWLLMEELWDTLEGRWHRYWGRTLSQIVLRQANSKHQVLAFHNCIFMSMFVMCCLALVLYRSASTTSSVWSPLVLFSASPAPDPDQSSSHWQYVSVAGVFSPGSWCLPGCVP